MKRSLFTVLALLVAVSMVLAACAPAAAPTATPKPAPTEAPTEAPEEAPTEAPTEAPEPTKPPAKPGEKVQVRWYVGLGAGSDAPVIPLQEEFVAEYNASQDQIELVLEVVDADSAYDVLNTQIAAGNAPDIVGPLGIND